MTYKKVVLMIILDINLQKINIGILKILPEEAKNVITEHEKYQCPNIIKK